jgi:hypothetical protein
VQQGFLFGRGFGNPAQADLASIRGGQHDVGALQRSPALRLILATAGCRWLGETGSGEESSQSQVLSCQFSVKLSFGERLAPCLRINIMLSKS